MEGYERVETLNDAQLKELIWRNGVRCLPFLTKELIEIWPKRSVQWNLYVLLNSLDVYVGSFLKVIPLTEVKHTASDVSDLLSDTHSIPTISLNQYSKSKLIRVIEGITQPLDAVSKRNWNNRDSLMVVVEHSIYLLEDISEQFDINIREVINLDIKSSFKNISLGWKGSGKYYRLLDEFFDTLNVEGCSAWYDVYAKMDAHRMTLKWTSLEERLNVPKEIKDLGVFQVSNYIKKLKYGSRRLNEARIIILGDKGAGKTSLARKLIRSDAPLPGESESTAGVDTSLWDLEKSDIRVHIWDFAGHTTTHAVHQFFLSERCLYLLVCNGRVEEYNRLEYWLSQMQNFGGESEVVVLVNKKDNHNHSIPVNKLKSKFPIHDIYNFSLANDVKKVKEFREELSKFIVNNPSWEKQQIPEGYFKVKEKLEELFEIGNPTKGRERIKKREFYEIAKEYKIDDEDALLRDLHNLGISLWYEEIESVDTLILNPEWISHGIYKIINWVHNNGKHSILLREFTEVFKLIKARYPSDQHLFLFNLMKHYKLAFEVEKGSDKKLVIPHLLDSDRPYAEQLPDFPIGESLMIRYKSEINLPTHTVSRFIVRHNEEIKKVNRKPLVWKEGVVLTNQKGDTALVIEDDRTITVSVKGPTRTQYLDSLRKTLNEVFEIYKRQKPDLQCRIQRFGEIKEEVDNEFPLWMSDSRIWQLSKRDIPHPDDLTGQFINLNETVNNYFINEGNLINGNLGNYIRGNQNNFNFYDSNVKIQGLVNELSQMLIEEGEEGFAMDLMNILKSLEGAEQCKSPQELRKNGIANRLQGFVNNLSEKDSKLNKAVKGIKNGISVAKDIAKEYNNIAEWCGLPQVPKVLLKTK